MSNGVASPPPDGAMDSARTTRDAALEHGVVTERMYWRGKPVPYITRWTAESVPQPRVVRRITPAGEGIGFEGEDPRADRRYGVLSIRSALARGCGEPNFRLVHPHRQRRAMEHSLCQVCSGPADTRADGRTLYLLGAAKPIAEVETTTAPPVHPPCAIEAVEHCPPLGRGHAVALVERATLYGVAGVIYDPETLAPLPHVGTRPGELAHVDIAAAASRWTLASFTVVSLHGVTAVSSEELHAMANATAS
ncbi:hypothetical protein [Streptomyces arenae]|uniref:hypothetical protein n=1 Tax=Streptomyces arenae TaxID=29301 RepID=UPI002658BBFF|nr:hypothetical protein [Streptomyces arenae]MCG7202351.1 hypothetical protein [Streptomyces arenae]